MKQLWCSLSIIVLLILSSLLSVSYLEHFVDTLSSSLSDAQNYAKAGEQEKAQSITHSVQQQFESHAFYLHIMLAHQDIDNIEMSFGEVLEYLSRGETGALYASANARLLAQLRLLVESEQLNLKNVL